MSILSLGTSNSFSLSARSRSSSTEKRYCSADPISGSQRFVTIQSPQRNSYLLSDMTSPTKTNRYFSFFSTYPEIGHASPAPKTCAVVSFSLVGCVRRQYLLDKGNAYGLTHPTIVF